MEGSHAVRRLRTRQRTAMGTRSDRPSAPGWSTGTTPSPAPPAGSDAGGSAASTPGVHRRETTATVISGVAVCPNCGGTEFDADGDCMTCWELGVVGPVAGSSSMEENELPTHASSRRRANHPR